MSQDCIFCKIVTKQIPATVVYEDEQMMAFSDIHPVAPVHIVVIPKKHIASLIDTAKEDEALLGHIMSKIPDIATEAGLAEDGFRVVVNTREMGGQTVNHLHWHILGGRFMTWPPG